MRDAVKTYRNVSVQTASRGEILLALYDAALRHTHTARDAIEAGDVQRKGQSIDSALAILAELSGTLDAKVAPELCANLGALYAYFMRCLQQASSNMQVDKVDEVLAHLRGLRETWSQAVHQARSGAA